MKKRRGTDFRPQSDGLIAYLFSSRYICAYVLRCASIRVFVAVHLCLCAAVCCVSRGLFTLPLGSVVSRTSLCVLVV
jgi:hypothetical protein